MSGKNHARRESVFMNDNESGLRHGYERSRISQTPRTPVAKPHTSLGQDYRVMADKWVKRLIFR